MLLQHVDIYMITKSLDFAKKFSSRKVEGTLHIFLLQRNIAATYFCK